MVAVLRVPGCRSPKQAHKGPAVLSPIPDCHHGIPAAGTRCFLPESRLRSRNELLPLSLLSLKSLLQSAMFSEDSYFLEGENYFRDNSLGRSKSNVAVVQL